MPAREDVRHTQPVKVSFKGLVTFPNELTLVDGALIVADNVVLDKPGIVESRRGFPVYGTSVANDFNQYFEYKSTLLAHHGSTLVRDSDLAGTWVAYTGTYAPPTGYKVRSSIANSNFFFTTTAGIKKLDTITATPRDAGTPKALDLNLTLTGASGFLANDSVVAYRIIWGYKDANENLILGAPSGRVEVANSSGGTRDVSVNFTIPAGITTSYFYQIYRSKAASPVATATPSDDLQLAIEKVPTSGEITAGVITVTDNVIEALLGADLYTNSTLSGILGSNEQPPIAKDITTYKNHTFYANTKQKHRLNLNLISVGSPDGVQNGDRLNFVERTTNNVVNGTFDTDTIWVKDTGWTISGGAAHATSVAVGTSIRQTGILTVGRRYMIRYTISNYVSGTVRASLGTATGGSFTANQTVCEFITCTGTGDVKIENIVATGTFDIDDVEVYGGFFVEGAAAEDIPNAKFKVSTAASPADKIEETGLSIVKVVNRFTGNTTIYGQYISGFDDAPGAMLFEERTIGGNTFHATTNRTTAFTPTMGSDQCTSTAVASSSETKLNRVYISKLQQPEAVPLLNFKDIGSADKPIQRILALRDAAFVLKDDGIFRISGETTADFRVDEHDATTIIKGKNTAVVFNNRVWCMSQQGVVSVSDAIGTKVESRDIEDLIIPLTSSNFTNFESASFGVGYESDRKYILSVPTVAGDTTATQQFAYNIFTDTWTRWAVRGMTAAIVNSTDDKLYFGNPTGNLTHKERKSFTTGDFADEEFPVTITSSTGVTVNMTSTTNVTALMTLKQGTREAVVLTVNSATQVTVDHAEAWTVGAATVFTPIDCKAKWVAEHGGNPALVKHFVEIVLFFRDALFRQADIGFTSNFTDVEEVVTVDAVLGGQWGLFPWGGEPWGVSTGGPIEIRTLVTENSNRALWLMPSVRVKQSFTLFSLAGYGMLMRGVSEKF